uniref:Uncharacterized protein n=1 Tax=Glossina austeni TaxID=7395 RepID=A0A1A9VI60_GLOAU
MIGYQLTTTTTTTITIRNICIPDDNNRSSPRKKIRQNKEKQKIKKKNSEHKIQTLPINKQLEGAVTKNQANTKAGEQTCSQSGKQAGRQACTASPSPSSSTTINFARQAMISCHIINADDSVVYNLKSYDRYKKKETVI